MGIFHKIHNFISTVQQRKREPMRLEFVLSDYCNLNCKGCTHYSPLAPDEFESLEHLEKNAAHLGKAVGDKLDMVYLIGGETLLYPHIDEAMKIMRRHFPDIRIYVFTNGLLLPRMNATFWQTARSNDITIALTRYPIHFDYDAVEQLCKEKGVKYEIFADRNEDNSFMRFPLDPQKGQNGRLSHFKCFNHGCVSIVGDRIYPCSISACIGHLNNRFGTDFKHEKGDWIDINDVHDISVIKRLRNRPVPFCSYCKNPTFTPYGPSKREKTEWVD